MRKQDAELSAACVVGGRHGHRAHGAAGSVAADGGEADGAEPRVRQHGVAQEREESLPGRG